MYSAWYIGWFIVNTQYLSAAEINSIIILSLISTMKNSKVTKSKSFPQESYNSGKDGFTLTPDLPLTSVTHEALDNVKHVAAEPQRLQGADYSLISEALI